MMIVFMIPSPRLSLINIPCLTPGGQLLFYAADHSLFWEEALPEHFQLYSVVTGLSSALLPSLSSALSSALFAVSLTLVVCALSPSQYLCALSLSL